VAIWYKTYAALKDHPKVLMFTNAIGAANEIEGLGYLHLFFSAVCAYAEDGGIEKIPIPVLEKMCRWSGDTGKFIEALEKSGFIDKTPEGRIVHEWWEINGHQVKEHERKEKNRKKRGPGADEAQDGRVTDRQTDRQTDLSNKRDSIDEALRSFVALRAVQGAYKGISYDPGERGRRGATNLICGPKPPTKQEFDDAAKNFFDSDAGITTSNHAAHAFFENFYSYLSAPINRGRAQQRPQYAGHGADRGKGGGNDLSSKAGSSRGPGGRPGKGHGPAID
jgi:hypothetical protein